jgi:hypothetical protein
MTVCRTYSCDLCKDTISGYREAIGIRWETGHRIRNVLISDSERHICNACCKSLRDMFADMDRGDKLLDEAEA